MKFFEDTVRQITKPGKVVCGDACSCERSFAATEYILCDGIGSGVYANIAAIACSSRLMELFASDMSHELACKMVANSMHTAREQPTPFSAFSAARIMASGQFSVYSYESPAPIVIQDGTASVLTPHFYTAGYELIGESAGKLRLGDSLVLFSDGVSQAGLGKGLVFGIGSEGVAEHINRCLDRGMDVSEIADEIIELSRRKSGGRLEDDTTVAILTCREAKQLTILSGPPQSKSKDSAFVDRFMASDGARAVCGSTTSVILARELGREVRLKSAHVSMGRPPEYEMDGIDMITEGAVVLNQINNILLERPETFVHDTPAERLASMLFDADAVTFIVGRSLNEAHGDLLFRQLGILPRDATIKQISEKLKAKGKLVVTEYF